MDIIAIDIALLPSEEVIDAAIAINQKARSLGKLRFETGREDYIPHISLAMGAVKVEDLDEVSALVDEVCKNHKSFPLTIPEIGLFEGAGFRTFQFEISPSDNLKNLHLKLLDVLRPFIVPCDKPEMLFDGEKTGMTDSTSAFINEFEEKYAAENFFAHITLNSYDVDAYSDFLSFPISFQANRIAICQMGDACTCRKLLHETSLE